MTILLKLNQAQNPPTKPVSFKERSDKILLPRGKSKNGKIFTSNQSIKEILFSLSDE